MPGLIPGELLRVLLVSTSAELHEEVGAALAAGIGEFRYFWISQPDLALVRGQGLAPHVILVDGELGDALALIGQLRTGVSGIALLVLVPAGVPGLLLAQDALLAGAGGFLAKPVQADELTSTLRQVLGRRAALARPTEEAASGRVIVFCGPKGGTGRTTLAINTAVSLCRPSAPVVLVDADYAAPAIDVAMNLRGHRNIRDLMPKLSQLDADLVSGVLVTHSSGVKVLLAPPPDASYPAPTLPQVQQVIMRLKRMFPWVLVDLGLPLDEAAYAFLDLADRVIVSVLPEMVGVRNAKLMLGQFAHRGYPQDKIWPLLNREGLGGGLIRPTVETVLGRPLRHAVPNDQVLATETINSGVPMVISHQRRQVSRSYQALAGLLEADRAAAATTAVVVATPAAVTPAPAAAPVAVAAVTAAAVAEAPAARTPSPAAAPVAQPAVAAVTAEAVAEMPAVRAPSPATAPVAQPAAAAVAETPAAVTPSSGRAPAPRPARRAPLLAGVRELWADSSRRRPYLGTAITVIAIVLLLSLAIPWLLQRFQEEPGRPGGVQQAGVVLATRTATPTPGAGSASAGSSATAAVVAALTPLPPVTETATPSPTIAATATPTPTPTATVTPSPLPTATETAAPTATATSTPTATATPTATNTVRPTATPRPARTATPRPAATPALTVSEPALIGPAQYATVGGVVTFRWQPTGPLPPGTAYEVVWWNEGEDPAVARGIAPPTTAAELSADLDVLYASGQLRETVLRWDVLIVRTQPYARLTQPSLGTSYALVYQPSAATPRPPR